MGTTTLDDVLFMDRLAEHKGNKSALARELHVSASAISKRVKKIKRSPRQKDEEKCRGQETIDAFQLLCECRQIFRDLLAEVQREIGARGGKSNSLHRRQLMAIATGMQNLAKTYFDMQARIHTVKTCELFIEIVLEVLQTVTPEAKREILHRLHGHEGRFMDQWNEE